MGPGDGTTMVIPGSHKANFTHPQTSRHAGDQPNSPNESAEGIELATQVFMDPGDALLFVDALCHGSAKRTNLGTRRTIVYRYGPSWGNFRHGYQPSPQLLERLSPARRAIVQPQVPITRGPQYQPNKQRSVHQDPGNNPRL